MPADKSITNWLWPEIVDIDSAKAAAKRGYWAAVFVAAANALLATIALLAQTTIVGVSPLAYIDAALFALIARGIKNYSRVFAIFGVGLFIVEKMVVIPNTGSAFLVAVILILMFITGARGVFGYNRFSVPSDYEHGEIASKPREARIRENVEQRLAAARPLLEAEESRLVDEVDRQNALHQEARHALAGLDLPAFRKVVTKITDIDRTGYSDGHEFRSLLCLGSEVGDHNFVELLLELGADANQSDPFRGGATPLQLAAQHGHVSIVRLLIQRGADVNARDQRGNTALWYASYPGGGNIHVVTLLLRLGADPEMSDIEGLTPLDWATMPEPRHQNAAVVAVLRSAHHPR